MRFRGRGGVRAASSFDTGDEDIASVQDEADLEIAPRRCLLRIPALFKSSSY
jgi:hypothetical protein